MAEIRRAIEAFAFTNHTGCPRVITPGVLMSTDDPDYKGKESLFEPVEVAAARPGLRAAGIVEDTSAEPNAKRSVGRPRRR
jgi:hypothetical protein